MATPYRVKGSTGIWDWESNGNNACWADLITGKVTVQDILDMAQANWDESYKGLPAMRVDRHVIPPRSERIDLLFRDP